MMDDIGLLLYSLIAIVAILTVLFAYLGGIIKKIASAVILSGLIVSVSVVVVLGYTGNVFDFKWGRSDTALIEMRIEDFLDAYNSGDMDAILECMDSKTKNTLEASMSITEGLIGTAGLEINIADLFGLGVGIVSDGDLLTVEDLEIDIMSEDSAQVTTILSYKDKYSEKASEYACFEMTKENGDWFITDLK